MFLTWCKRSSCFSESSGILSLKICCHQRKETKKETILSETSYIVFSDSRACVTSCKGGISVVYPYLVNLAAHGGLQLTNKII